MPSKQVVDRQKEAQAVIAAGTTHAPAIVEGLTALLAPVLQRGEKLPDLELLLKLALRVLEGAQRDLVDADEAYQRELLDDAEPRQRRDESAAALREQLMAVRDLLEGIFGEAMARRSGFTAETPEEPVLLSRFARQVSGSIQAGTLPKPRLPGLKINPTELSAELDARRARLDQALADVTRESKEAQAGLSARDAATASFDTLYQGVANLVVGLLRLAGKPDLAARVRLTWRRSGPADPGTPDSPPPGPAPNP